jgi:hypothetical protein
MVYKTGGTKNQVIMDMPPVCMRGQNVLISPFGYLVGKAFSYLVRLFRRTLPRLKRLYQVMGEVVTLIPRP